MTDLIHLKTAGGGVIGFSVPLHDTICKQWAKGELSRVHEDGSLWLGDDGYEAFVTGTDTEPEVEAEDDGPEDPADSAPVEPKRPGANAHQRTWAKYAVALGACTEDEAKAKSKDELVALTTPPELQPEE